MKKRIVFWAPFASLTCTVNAYAIPETYIPFIEEDTLKEFTELGRKKLTYAIKGLLLIQENYEKIASLMFALENAARPERLMDQVWGEFTEKVDDIVSFAKEYQSGEIVDEVVTLKVAEFRRANEKYLEWAKTFRTRTQNFASNAILAGRALVGEMERVNPENGNMHIYSEQFALMDSLTEGRNQQLQNITRRKEIMLDIMRDAHLQSSNYHAALTGYIHDQMMEVDSVAALRKQATSGLDSLSEELDKAGTTILNPAGPNSAPNPVWRA